MKLIILFTLFIILANYLLAQTSIGLKSGITIPNVVFKPSIEQATIFTFNGGLVFKHFEEKNAGIQIEVNYSQKGWKEIIDTVNSYKRVINYLEIPFMSQFYVGSDKFRVFLNMGSFVGYAIGAGEIIESDSGIENRKYTFTNADNRSDFGLLGGLGINYTTSLGVLQLEGRFSQSLTDVRSTGGSKNQVINVTMAYLFGIRSLKKKANKN